MKKLILIGLLFQICCTNSKTDRINSNTIEIIGGNKNTEESTKNSKYCFRDFDCAEHLESEGFDSVWVDNTEILRIGLKLICNQTYSYSDTTFFTKNSPCDSDSVIYRYVRNSLNIQHTFKGTTKLIEITPFSFNNFFEDKRLAIKGYIGNSFSILINKDDSLVTVRVPVYFREVDIGEIATIEIDKLGNWTVKSIEKYEGFVPD